MVDWAGIFSVAITPFTDDGAVDQDRFLRFVDASVDNGADGIIVAGSTGEFYTLTAVERRGLFQAAVDRLAGRGCPVLAGVSDLRIGDVIAACRDAEQAGCAGALVLPPVYAMPDRREILAFYRGIASATDLPLMLYNSPRRAGVDLTVDLVAELADLPSVVAIKDSSANIVRVAELCQALGKRLQVFVGYETMIRSGLAVGAQGVVAMAHQLSGRLVRSLFDAVLAGDAATVDRLEPALFALYRCFQSGSYYAAIKATMTALGQPAGHPRPPLLPVSDAAAVKITGILADAGVAEAIASVAPAPAPAAQAGAG